MSLRCWSMRIAIAAAASVAAPLTLAAASCDSPDPCAARACRLDADIARAKAQANTKALARLERERADMGHCSDDGLKQKRKVALEQAQHRIDLREAELKKVEATGSAAKTKKAQNPTQLSRRRRCSTAGVLLR